jgi:hypothetical protein
MKVQGFAPAESRAQQGEAHILNSDRASLIEHSTPPVAFIRNCEISSFHKQNNAFISSNRR